MSNSTTPSNKNGKKNSNVDKANKDKNSQSATNVTSDTSKNTPLDKTKPATPTVETTKLPNHPTTFSTNSPGKPNDAKPTDKIVEVEPEAIKPTDKIVEVEPEQMKSVDKLINKAEETKTADNTLGVKTNDVKPADSNAADKKVSDEKATAKKPVTSNSGLKADEVKPEIKPMDKKADTKNDNVKPSDKKIDSNKPASSDNSNQTKSSNLGTTLSIVAIALVIGLGAGLYYHGHTQSKMQLETIQSLQTQVQALQTDLNGVQQSYAALSNNSQNDQILTQQKQLQDQFRQQQQVIANVEKESASQLEQFKALQSKVSTLSTTEANLWLLAEADFLVKQAVRKLNTEKDITTAIALLTSADASIRDMNDPSLHELRNALQHDVTTLSAIKRIDIDGTVIKLHQLSDQLDKMVLVKNQLEDEVPAPENLEVSDNISDWQENLSKTWKGFVSDFITITPIETNTVSDVNKPELTANQGAYLRENIRLQLLIAAQAVPGYQADTYNQALDKAMSWVKEYYDLENPVNQGFIRELEQLQKQNIKIDIPTQLSSQPLLNKQVESRLRSLLTQNASPVNAE